MKLIYWKILLSINEAFQSISKLYKLIYELKPHLWVAGCTFYRCESLKHPTVWYDSEFIEFVNALKQIEIDLSTSSYKYNSSQICISN